MCGTAAVVVKVSSITRGDKTYEFHDFDTIASLRDSLTGVQCGEVEDVHGWMTEVCDVYDENLAALPDLASDSWTPGMVKSETKGSIHELGSNALQGLERHLLEYVVTHARPGEPESASKAMDEFWNKTFQREASDKWNVRGQVIEEKLREKVAEKTMRNHRRPVRCLELGTYCGYSALRIAKNLPEGGFLLSVEKDELFAAIATKILEFAGLDHKVKIWMGTAHSELANITERLENEPADFVLIDHSKERYVPDLKLLEECGVVGTRHQTTVVGDAEVYPGDDALPIEVQREITQYFGAHEHGLFIV